MKPTVVRLDERFSDPDAVVADWDEVLRALERTELFWITTVRADGRPHVTPLVAVWLDDAIHFATGDGEQKAVNLRANRHVMLTTGCSDWDRGIDVVVEGDAVRTTDDRLLERLADAWGKKWDGRWRYETTEGAFQHEGGRGGVALVFSVAPVKILAFTKGRFSQTTYRF